MQREARVGGRRRGQSGRDESGLLACIMRPREAFPLQHQQHQRIKQLFGWQQHAACIMHWAHVRLDRTGLDTARTAATATVGLVSLSLCRYIPSPTNQPQKRSFSKTAAALTSSRSAGSSTHAARMAAWPHVELDGLGLSLERCKTRTSQPRKTPNHERCGSGMYVAGPSLDIHCCKKRMSQNR